VDTKIVSVPSFLSQSAIVLNVILRVAIVVIPNLQMYAKTHFRVIVGILTVVVENVVRVIINSTCVSMKRPEYRLLLVNVSMRAVMSKSVVKIVQHWVSATIPLLVNVSCH